MADPADRRSTEQDSIALLQDIFILLALEAGMNVDAVRKHLKVNKWRVSNISKHLKSARKSKTTNQR